MFELCIINGTMPTPGTSANGGTIAAICSLCACGIIKRGDVAGEISTAALAANLGDDDGISPSDDVAVEPLIVPASAAAAAPAAVAVAEWVEEERGEKLGMLRRLDEEDPSIPAPPPIVVVAAVGGVAADAAAFGDDAVALRVLPGPISTAFPL